MSICDIYRINHLSDQTCTRYDSINDILQIDPRITRSTPARLCSLLLKSTTNNPKSLAATASTATAPKLVTLKHEPNIPKDLYSRPNLVAHRELKRVNYVSKLFSFFWFPVLIYFYFWSGANLLGGGGS